MTLRRLWILTTILGFATAALAAVIFPLFPDNGYAISDGYGGAVYAFEMARVPDDLIAIFGPDGDPQRPERIAAMNAGNLWDYPFMAAYAGFMACFLATAYRSTGGTLWAVFAAIGALSGAADAAENAILLGITADMNAAPFLSILAVPVWVKFFAIALSVAAAGAFIARAGGLWRAAGLLASLAMLSVPIAFIDAAQFGYLSGIGIGIGWIIMLAFALRQAVKPAS